MYSALTAATCEGRCEEEDSKSERLSPLQYKWVRVTDGSGVHLWIGQQLVYGVGGQQLAGTSCLTLQEVVGLHPSTVAHSIQGARWITGSPTEVEVDSFIQNVWRQPHTLHRPTSKDCYIVPPTPSTCLMNLSWATPSQDFVRLLQCRIQSHLHSRVDWQSHVLPATSPP